MEKEDANDTVTASDDEDDGSYDELSRSSYDVDEENSQYSYIKDGEDRERGRSFGMPPLKYARIMGNLPRQPNSSAPKTATSDGNGSTLPSSKCPSLSVKVTCSAIGRIVLCPSTDTNCVDNDSSILSSSRHGANGSTAHPSPSPSSSCNPYNQYDQLNDDEETDRSMTKIQHVLALGFEDGTIRLVDVLSGGSVLFGSSALEGGAWVVNPAAARRFGGGGGNAGTFRNTHAVGGDGSGNRQRIVSLSFDSSTSYLAAMNADGDAAIFGPLVWGRQFRRPLGAAISGTSATSSSIPAGASNSAGVADTTNKGNVGGDSQQASNKLTSFLSSFGTQATIYPETQTETQTPTPTFNSYSNDTKKNRTQPMLRPPFVLIKPPSATIRFSYSDPHREPITSSLLHGLHHGEHGAPPTTPTCMVLEPSYGRRKDRTLIVGFDDGRLIYSKLQIGFSGVTSGVTSGVSAIGSGITSFFGGGGGIGGGGGGGTSGAGGSIVKKVDSVLYQGMGFVSSSYVGGGGQNGIEAVAWRGGLVAWADSSGVKLFDIDSMTRIAQIDRPTGARSSLYPTISTLSPSIIFERSDSLLIGWGDCVMTIIIRDPKPHTSPIGKEAALLKVKRKTLDFTMAWELDCVVCGVVPMDEKHVAVLGLVPSPSEPPLGGEVTDDFLGRVKESPAVGDAVAGGDNVLELQIINREDGKSISNDILQLLDCVHSAGSTKRNYKHIITSNVSDFSLLSSFITPRMDDATELKVFLDGERDGYEKLCSEQVSDDKFLDLHLKWNMTKDICFTEFDEMEGSSVIRAESRDEEDDESQSSANNSVCSDDYVFVFGEPIGDILPGPDLPSSSSPPVMVLVGSYDVCLAVTRDVDDAISYARSIRKPALALKLAMAHRRDVRRHGLDQLVDEYFAALLRVGDAGTAILRGKTAPSNVEQGLSLSRLKIAAKSMPLLLGGDSRMWQRWIFMLAGVQGGLFVIREHIPVRDPQLPSFIFEMTLEKMLDESCSNFYNQNTSKIHNRKSTLEKLSELFLESLRAWGPTSALRRRIQLNRYTNQSQPWKWHSISDSSKMVDPLIQQAQKDLQRRISQTAFGFLTDTSLPHQVPHIPVRQHIESSSDSLFDVNQLALRFSKRLMTTDDDGTVSGIVLGTLDDNAAVIIEAVAELECMREKFGSALAHYLVIGSRFMNESLSSLEDSAVLTVNSYGGPGNFVASTVPFDTARKKYEHVLALIELHQLHYVLLKKNPLLLDTDVEPEEASPIISLTRLIGLEKAGRFLIECLSPPEDSITDEKEKKLLSQVDSANLPLDLVVNQLKSRPKLLYWFLFQVFIHKPDMYVKFPTTAVPPLAITDLHRIQFSLFVNYADNGERVKTTNTPSFFSLDKESPFMMFLKAALPHGGARPEYVRQMLKYQRGGKIDSPIFARELAFVIENFGGDSVDDAKEIIQLYLHGTKNLYMAVAFAERNSKHSSMLWESLVDHCTSKNDHSENGVLFGELLEAAAAAGADLASLVSRIPKGMAIEGLRPKLIAAVTDYRHKVKMHENVLNILSDEKICILRELSHFSQRGSRIDGMRKVPKVKDGIPGQNPSKSLRHNLLDFRHTKSNAIAKQAFTYLSIR